MLAFEKLRDERRARLTQDIIEQVGGEMAIVAQIIMSATE
jgi:hypothetical protein